MSDTDARKLAIRLLDFQENHDLYGYLDLLGDFDNNVDLVLEHIFNNIKNRPEDVIDHLLTILENQED